MFPKAKGLDTKRRFLQHFFIYAGMLCADPDHDQDVSLFYDTLCAGHSGNCCFMLGKTFNVFKLE